MQKICKIYWEYTKNMKNYMLNMQNMHKNMLQNMWKICNNLKICEKYAEYALKYAKFVKYMGKCDIQRICIKICKICKICQQKCDMQNIHSPLQQMTHPPTHWLPVTGTHTLWPAHWHRHGHSDTHTLTLWHTPTLAHTHTHLESYHPGQDMARRYIRVWTWYRHVCTCSWFYVHVCPCMYMYINIYKCM